MSTLDPAIFAPCILLVLAFGYFLAGVHLDRPLLWIGLLMTAGYVALFFIDRYAWTLIGVTVAIGLALSGWLSGRNRGAVA